MSAWRPRAGSADSTSAISIGRTRRAEQTMKSRRLRFMAGSMQPAEWVVGVVLDADLEVEAVRGGAHPVAQRYHIVLCPPPLPPGPLQRQEAARRVHPGRPGLTVGPPPAAH